MKGVTKRFDSVVALDDAHITVQDGEIHALLGANGSGKSTLVKVLSGLVRPDSGDVTMDGKRVDIRNAKDSRNYKIATAYQDLSLVPAMSVLDNVMLGIEPKRALGMIDRKKAAEKAKSILQKLKINCDLGILVQSLMPSTQSMIEVAKCLAMEPDLLILDETTASLHSDEVDTLFEVLEEIKSAGTSVIMVTHRMGEIYRVCQSYTILRGGVTVAEGAMQEATLDDVVYHMTGKRPEVAGEKAAEAESAADVARVLDVKGLSVIPRLRSVDFAVGKGEIVGVGGLDGQGQSEFLRCLLADIKADAGEVIYKVGR